MGTFQSTCPANGAPDVNSVSFCQGELMRVGEKLRVDVRSSQVTPLIGVFDMFSASLTGAASRPPHSGDGQNSP